MTYVPNWVLACIAGAIIGFAYTLSPMTFWFGVAMVPLFAWAGRGLGRRERVWVFGLLGSAVVLRLLALVAFVFATRRIDGSLPALIPDEAFIAYRSSMLRYIALDVPVAEIDYTQSAGAYGQTGLHYVHAFLELALGEAPYAIRLFEMTLYLTASVMLFRTVRPVFGSLATLGGFAVVLFMPSLFVWSIAILKEAPAQFLVAASLCAGLAAARGRTLRVRLFWWAIVGAALLAMSSVRSGGEVIAGGGIAAGIVGGSLMRRPRWLALALALGVAGAAVALQSPGVRDRVRRELVNAAVVHAGYVNTSGWNYRLLDSEFYLYDDSGGWLRPAPERFTLAVTARYLIRATASAFLVPLPWQVASLPGLVYLPEQLAWNLLLALALVGIVAGLRIDATVTLTLAGVIIAGAVAVGAVSGNIGTLIRHRSIFMFLLPWLSGLGACEVLTWASCLRARACRSAGVPVAMQTGHAIH